MMGFEGVLGLFGSSVGDLGGCWGDGEFCYGELGGPGAMGGFSWGK